MGASRIDRRAVPSIRILSRLSSACHDQTAASIIIGAEQRKGKQPAMQGSTQARNNLNVAGCVCTQGCILWSQLGPSGGLLELLWPKKVSRCAVVDVRWDVVPQGHESLQDSIKSQPRSTHMMHQAQWSAEGPLHERLRPSNAKARHFCIWLGCTFSWPISCSCSAMACAAVRLLTGCLDTRPPCTYKPEAHRSLHR